MKVRDFKNLLEKYGDRYLDNELVVLTEDPSIGPSGSVSVKGIAPGFDWNTGKMMIVTEPRVIKKVNKPKKIRCK